MNKKAWKHFCTIHHHRKLVRKGCFQVGLYRQGLLHDLSKYCPTEFLVGCRFYQGYMSPNNAERKERGYSSAWLHHKGRNKHHLEYWVDYATSEHEPPDGGYPLRGMKMPVNYVVEMFIDRLSASKTYLGKENYTNKSALDYYQQGKARCLLHEDTASLLELLLEMNYRRGEKKTFRFIRSQVLSGKIPYRKQELDARKEELLQMTS